MRSGRRRKTTPRRRRSRRPGSLPNAPRDTGGSGPRNPRCSAGTRAAGTGCRAGPARRTTAPSGSPCRNRPFPQIQSVFQPSKPPFPPPLHDNSVYSITVFPICPRYQPQKRARILGYAPFCHGFLRSCYGLFRHFLLIDGVEHIQQHARPDETEAHELARRERLAEDEPAHKRERRAEVLADADGS